MTDILERLRDAELHYKMMNDRDHEIFGKAADEIEQRRKTSQFHKDSWLAAETEIERLREALKIIHSRVTDMPKNITPNLAIAMFSAVRYQTTTALGEKE